VKHKNLKIENLSCHEPQLKEFILPILRGNLFDLTNRSGFKGILKDGLIRNNRKGEFPYSFPQSARSYARTRGYVSLFDLRATSKDRLETVFDKFYFLNPPNAENNPIFLILSESLYPELIPWTRARDEDAWDEMFIPRVEAFHQGDIPIFSINRVLSLKIKGVKKRQNSLSRLMDKAVQELYAPGGKSSRKV